MVHSCCVVGCHKRRGRDKGVSFFVIPAIIYNQGEKTKELSSNRRSAWIRSLNRKNRTPSSNSRICSQHFLRVLKFTAGYQYFRKLWVRRRGGDTGISVTPVFHRFKVHPAISVWNGREFARVEVKGNWLPNPDTVPLPSTVV